MKKDPAKLARSGASLRNLMFRILVHEADVPELLTRLQDLSHGEFRAMSVALADRILPNECTEEQFWQIFLGVVPTNPKAFLGTFLKAAVRRYEEGNLHITLSLELQSFAVNASPIDKRKTMDAFLPKVKTSEEVGVLLRLFVADEPKERVSALLKADTPPVCYCLFCELRKQEGDMDLIRQTALALMRRQTKRGYNLASIIQAYFGLDALPGSFSLSLKPYELSLLERSEEEFMKILNR